MFSYSLKMIISTTSKFMCIDLFFCSGICFIDFPIVDEPYEIYLQRSNLWRKF